MRQICVAMLVGNILVLCNAPAKQNLLAPNALPAQRNLMFEDSLQEPAELASVAAIKPYGLMRFQNKDFLFDATFRARPESFYTKNVGFLSGNPLDQTFYAQSTWDFKMRATKANYIRAEVGMRSKGRWGVQTLFNTQESTVKILDVATGSHSHGISRLLLNVREAYFDFSLNKALSISTDREHALTIGAFSFELGRGIALGNAYAVSPGILGFFADNAIDQFPYGVLLHGDINPKGTLHYDLYGSILENYADSFSSVSAPVYTNRIQPNNTSFRGFGAIDYVLAARFAADIMSKDEHGKALTSESYIFYNHNPEQKIDFPAQAYADMGTVGFAFDYADQRYELGGECAFNFGKQIVYPWDRNALALARDTSSGSLFEIYTAVERRQQGTTSAWDDALYADSTKSLVDKSDKNPAYNGEIIGLTDTTPAFEIRNSSDRFIPGYTNELAGAMAVLDGAFYIKPKTLSLVGTLGWASGDEHPNYDLDEPNDARQNGAYGGFIGLQEVYSGKRVRSVFVIGSQRITRLLSAPATDIDNDDGKPSRFAQKVGGFTNLLYGGCGLQWKIENERRKWEVKPNILFYWNDQPSRRFKLNDNRYASDLLTTVTSVDITTADIGSSQDDYAPKFLGFEANCFIDVSLLDQLKFYFVGAFFIPGDHFSTRGVYGTPQNSEQYKVLTRVEKTGNLYGELPLLGNSAAFATNLGFQYEF